MHQDDTHHANPRGDRYADLNRSIEDIIVRFTDSIIPKLEKAGFHDCTEKLQHHIDLFDNDCTPPYSTDKMSAEEIKAAFDRSGAAMARMCGLLYQQVHEQCSFAEHYELMTDLMDAMRNFNRVAPAQLRTLGLDYHEFDSLTLELEAKLGIGAPPPDERPHERRRNLTKNPEKIEEALHKCMETAQTLRPMITNEKKQQKLDSITGDVGSILSNLPKGDDEVSRGRRISALISASAKILKVGKWIRKVELLHNEQSESAKREILRRFDTLADLSRGQEGHHR